MDEKKSKPKSFICEFHEGDAEAFAELAARLKVSKSEAVRVAVRLVLGSLREGTHDKKRS